MTTEAQRSDDTAAPAGERRRRRRRWWREPLLNALVVIAPIALSATLWLVSKTVRVEFVGTDDLFARWRRGEQSIMAFWHNRVVMMPIAYRGKKICIMNSQHRDGEIATRALARWHIRSVRGSATRGGAAGFLQLVNAYRSGYDLAVVPDGPRGPCCVAKPGIVRLAKATGAPIYPVTYAATRYRQLRSWDRLIIPLPFARVVFIAGAPVTVAPDADAAGLQQRRQALEDTLNQITREAEARLAS